MAQPQTIELNADDDNDSAIGGSWDDSSTASLSSSILDYREEHGRRYHAYKAGIYFLPNDERENDRLDMQHHIFLLTFKELYLAPIDKDKVNHVLDVGTGTGIWAIDFADKHPKATVKGVDLSPIQPSFLPPNLKFEIDDLEEPWTFKEKFDYIHSRMMTGSFTDFPAFFFRAFEHMKPEGYIEAVDVVYPIRSEDGSLKENSALKKWSALSLKASINLQRPVNTAFQYKSQLEAAGFVDVVEQVFRWPMNQWPKEKHPRELGFWTRENFLSALYAGSVVLFTKGLGWTDSEVETFLVQVRKEINDTNIHAYWEVYAVYGRKPNC